MMERTVLSFDSDFREWWLAEGGMESLRCDGGDTERGGVEDGDGTSAHSVDSDEKIPAPLLLGAHGVLLLDGGGRISIGSHSGVDVKGLGEGEGALVMIERGGKMLKIWSSACGGPYESKGSGTD
jgi:hypothetical protein